MRLSELEEASLMGIIKKTEILSNCEKEFNKLYRSLFPSLKNKLRSKYNRILQADDLDDLIQDTFRKVLEKRASYTDGANVYNWIFTIANNNIINFIKNNKREIDFSSFKVLNPEFDFDEIIDVGNSLENQIDRNDIIYQILNEINKIEDKIDRDIVYMKIVDDMNFQDISKKLNLAISTIHKRLNKRIVILKLKLSNII